MAQYWIFFSRYLIIQGHYRLKLDKYLQLSRCPWYIFYPWITLEPTWIKLIFYLETKLSFMLILFPLVNVLFIRLFDPFSNKNKTSFIGWGWGLRFSSRSPLLSAPSSIPQNSIFQTLDRLVPSFCPSVYFRNVCLSIFVKKRQIIKLKRL